MQTRQQIEQLLHSIGREPNRKLGQHFMIERAHVERLVGEGSLEDGPLVLEVGPGTGTLTGSLLEAGATVLAVEIDNHLADLLDNEFADARKAGCLHIVRGDVLETKHRINRQVVDELARLAGGGPVRLVANLPYNIASPLLAELIGLAWSSAAGRSAEQFRLDRLIFTVQREVAERLTAEPGTKEYGPLSVLCRGLGKLTVVTAKISPKVFYPMPNVWSSLLRVDLTDDSLRRVGDLAVLHAWLDAGFGHRRKTLAASIKLTAGWTDRLTAAAAKAGLDTSRRGETLSVEEYLELARATETS